MAGVLSPAEWLMKAEEARQVAATMRDAGARRTLLLIAAGYEKIARHTALMQKVDVAIDEGDGR